MQKNTKNKFHSSLVHLKDIIESYSFKSIVLISGKSSFGQAHVQKHLLPIIQQYSIFHFDEFSKNPEVYDVIKGIDKVKHAQNPLFIAIGGGSVLDMAKLIMFFKTAQIDPRAYLLGEVEKPSFMAQLSLIAIPTTAGTGSEATQFATLYIDKKKYSLDCPEILPSDVILDPLLTLNLPPQVTAESGADALSQSIESYWSIKSTGISKGYARKAIKLIYPSLYDAVHHPNLNNRKRMLLGAHYAGKAIQITRTTAPHALSYSLTSLFGLAHGQAVSLTLPSFLEYNSKITRETSLDPRGPTYVQKTIGNLCKFLQAKNPEEAADNLRKLFKLIRLKTSLAAAGISEKDCALILDHNYTPSRMKNNPRHVSREDALNILKVIQNEPAFFIT